MSLAKLSDREQQIVLQSLNAILKGRSLEEEFETRLGISREELEEIVAHFPGIDDSDDESPAALAVNNCMNEVSYGLPFSNEEWSQWFNVSREEVAEVYRKWAKLRG